jgi:Rrf2 family protein
MSYSLTYSQAILIVVYVADKIRQGLYEYVPARAVAESLAIPAPTVSKILQSLARAGIIETREGARGGIRLALPPAKVSLLDVLEAMEQKRSLFATMHINAKGERPTRAQRAIRDALGSAELAMRSSLREVSVADILKHFAPD